MTNNGKSNEPLSIIYMADGSEFGVAESAAETADVLNRLIAVDANNPVFNIELALGEGEVWINALQVVAARFA
jgi:hypothetical protein